MSAAGPTVLQVNAADRGGGAERVVSSLHAEFRRRGVRSTMVVGRRQGDDPHVVRLTPGAASAGLVRVLAWAADRVAGVGRVVDGLRGVESFRYPATRELPTLVDGEPDVIHLHNLHGGYFDLRALPRLGRHAPLVLTLHDAWLLSGHCAHSMGCPRWATGCGECPDLSIYPAVRRDETAGNWRRKARIFERTRVHLAAPCDWLIERARRSLLAPAIADARVIPNGVDLSVFRPSGHARAELDIPGDALVLLFVATDVTDNPFKDLATLTSAVSRIAGALPDREVLFLALGRDRRGATSLGTGVRVVPFESDPKRVARYYQAADLYLHAARADTFPLTLLEALACGTPVVATAVGGIPEQVRSLRSIGDDRWPAVPLETATGALSRPGDPEDLAAAALELLERPGLLRRLGENASGDAARRFDVKDQCDAYLGWYDELIQRRSRRDAMPHAG